jgi:hypothetical protein
LSTTWSVERGALAIAGEVALESAALSCEALISAAKAIIASIIRATLMWVSLNSRRQVHGDLIISNFLIPKSMSHRLLTTDILQFDWHPLVPILFSSKI